MNIKVEISNEYGNGNVLVFLRDEWIYLASFLFIKYEANCLKLFSVEPEPDKIITFNDDDTIEIVNSEDQISNPTIEDFRKYRKIDTKDIEYWLL